MLKINRYKTAPLRRKLSMPVMVAIQRKILTRQITHFDYGCGFGFDVKRLQELGYHSSGYDPFYFPNHPLVEADVVTLGYVLNVIEDAPEREDVLIQAWQLTQQTLIVAAAPSRYKKGQPYQDGIITQANTFEKYYKSQELQHYIEDILGVRACRLKAGIYAIRKQPSLIIRWSQHTQLEQVQAQLQQQRLSLTGWIPATDISLVRYSSRGKISYRLYSPQAHLPDNVKFLNVGSPGTEKYEWAIQALARRDQLLIVERRLNRLTEIINKGL